MSIVIFSCNTGGYDEPVPAPSLPFVDRFVMFSDRPDVVWPGWEVLPTQSPAQVKHLRLISKWHKFFGARLFPDATVAVWLDGNTRPTRRLRSLIAEFTASGARLGVAVHPQRQDLQSEAHACERLGKFADGEAALARDQLARYARLGMPSDARLLATALMMFRHASDPELQEAMALWWDEVSHYSRRDQLSLPYALWRSGLPVHHFQFDVFKNPYFRTWRHGAIPADTRPQARLARVVGRLVRRMRP